MSGKKGVPKGAVMKTMSSSARTAMAACVLCIACTASLALPQIALAKAVVDNRELALGDNSVGGGRATLSDSALDMIDVTAGNLSLDQNLTVNFNGGNNIETFYISGDANVEVNYSGENAVEDTHVFDNATATINADGHNEFEELGAYANANVTVNVTGENDFETITAVDNANITIRGTDCQKRDIVNVGDEEKRAQIRALNGNVVIDHVTVNLESTTAFVGSTAGHLTVDTSKIASGDDNEYTEILAGKTMTVSESVIDITGTMRADGKMTIRHSDIEAEAPNSSYDKSPYRIYSKTGIELIREKNGEVKSGMLNGEKVFFVDTGDGTDVDLEADGKPGYYACADDEAEHIMTHVAAHKTGDASDPWGLSMLALASATTACYAMKRRRDDARPAGRHRS